MKKFILLMAVVLMYGSTLFAQGAQQAKTNQAEAKGTSKLVAADKSVLPGSLKTSRNASANGAKNNGNQAPSGQHATTGKPAPPKAETK